MTNGNHRTKEQPRLEEILIISHGKGAQVRFSIIVQSHLEILQPWGLHHIPGEVVSMILTVKTSCVKIKPFLGQLVAIPCGVLHNSV